MKVWMRLILASFLIASVTVDGAPSPITQAEAEAAIKSFYRDMEGSDLDKMINHFDQTVKWYDMGSKDLPFITQTLQQYCYDYPSRSYSTGAVQVKPIAGVDGVTVNFDMRFFLRNPGLDDNKSGRSHVEWDLVKRDGAIKITRFAGSEAKQSTSR